MPKLLQERYQPLAASGEQVAETAAKVNRATKKRADVQASLRENSVDSIVPEGSVWACCCATQFDFDAIHEGYRRAVFDPNEFTDVLFLRCFGGLKTGFVFTFGCVVGWDMSAEERLRLLHLLRPYRSSPDLIKYDEDEMSYVRDGNAAPMIRLDTIRLTSERAFERLAYSYAFAQCVKLSYFEDNVDDTIERTKSIPESLAKTGKINSSREEISRRIGELFTSRFYINLHTDILDTPDILWEFDEFCDQYAACRNYLEIPKRVEILNQRSAHQVGSSSPLTFTNRLILTCSALRLDIIKDLYDMLNAELSIEHGHRLEWIVIYLICVEVAIEVVWNILIKDVFKLV